jgi:palmitoyltransferase
VLGRLERQGRMVPRTIPYPRPAEENAVILQDALGQEAGASGTRGIDDLPPTQATRTFAILELPAGANPWDCGPLANVKEVLGHSFLDWFLPLKRSPCAIHNDPDSMFKLGPAVAKAKQEAGLIDGPEHAGPSEGVGEQRKKRRRRRSEGPVDAESSTDGERRARRHRHRHRHRERRASSARGAR